MLWTVLKALGMILFWWAFMYFAGFVFCKTGHAKSIEEGITVFLVTVAEEGKKIFHFLFKIFRPVCSFLGRAFYNEWTGHDLPKKLIRTELILLNEEVLELVRKFKDSPYIVPSLSCYDPNNLDILWLDIKAVGLVSRYQQFTRSNICEMAENIVQNFYLETRGSCVRVFIKIASPTRLYFAIPLSEEAEEYLEKQEKVQENSEEEDFVLFQEEIAQEETEDFEDWL